MMHFIKKHANFLRILLLVLLSVSAWAVFFALGVTTVYNDAMSHLNVARLVVDNMQPGMSQLGSVWLPMSHLLELPFIWNDFLWHSGLAGAVVSMGAFVLGAVGIYKILIYLTESKKAGVIAVLAYCLSLNMLYLQSTALTEPLYVTLFIFTVLFFVKYLKYHSSKALIALGVISAIGILTRYDAWFVALVLGMAILVNELFVKKQKFQAILGYLMLYAFPVGFAALLWFGWNLLIFGDPLYSFIGPYSARAQQEIIQASSGLITKHNLPMSTWAYLLSVLQNVGSIVAIIGSFGWAFYMASYRQVTSSVKLFTFVACASVIVFNVVALYLGFSILNLPELGWNPSGTQAGELFNVRYGILALPFAAIGVGMLVARFRAVKIVVPAVVVGLLMAQIGITYTSGIITIKDGTVGSSAFVNQDIADAVRRHVKPGEKVIMSTSSYNAVAFESGLPLRSFVHEGVSSSWNGAISQPEKHGQWIVMAKHDVGEPVHESLVKKQQSAFLERYDLVFTGAYASLYTLAQ